jgi:hypothetical protein
MKFLFDKGSSQVQVQLETGTRLTTLFDAIEAQGWSYEIGPDRIDAASLADVDGLVVLTRHGATAPGTTNPFPANWDFAFTADELGAIRAFNAAGGGVLLISNHGPFSAANLNNNWTVNDRVLAAEFGVVIQPAAYQSPTPPLTMDGGDLSSNPALQASILAGVTSIVPNNSCAVSSPNSGSLVIASIPSNAVNTSPIFPDGPAGQSYAVLAGSGAGPVIVGGNSGIAGNAGTNYPGPGRIGTGSNLQFLLNCMEYIGARESQSGQARLAAAGEASA